DFKGLLAGVEAGKGKEKGASGFPPAAGGNDSLRLVNKPHFSCAGFSRLSQGVTPPKPNVTRGVPRRPPPPQGAPQEKQRRACAGRFEFRYQRRRPAMPFLEKPNGGNLPGNLLNHSLDGFDPLIPYQMVPLGGTRDLVVHTGNFKLELRQTTPG